MEFISFFVVLFLAFWIIYKFNFFKIKTINRHWIAIAYGIKILAAISLYLFYANQPRQKSDIFRFYDDAKIIASTISTHPALFAKFITGVGEKNKDYLDIKQKTNNWDSGSTPQTISNNKLIIRYLAIVQLVVFKSYWGTLALTITFGFVGLFFIFKTFSQVFNDRIWMLYFVVFYTPSLLFWTAGLLKETLIISLLGLIIHCIFTAIKGSNSFIHFVFALIATALLFQLRSIVAIILIISFIPFIWNYYRNTKRIFSTYFIALFILIALAFESEKFTAKSAWQSISDKRYEIINQAITDNSSSLIYEKPLNPNAQDIILYLPQSLIDVFLRPFPNQINNFTILLAFLENLLIISLLTLTMIFYKSDKSKLNLTYFLFVFAFLYLLIIGLTTPVVGAISRYRSIPLLFLEIFLISNLNIDKLRTTKLFNPLTFNKNEHNELSQ